MKSVLLLFTSFLCLRAESVPRIALETEDGWKISPQRDGIFADKETKLKISCTSNDPIQWTFEGEFGENTNLWMPQITVEDVTNVDSISHKIIYDAVFTTNVSGLITCSQKLNPSVRSELLVFVSLNSSIFLESEQTHKSTDFYGVACPITNPTIPVYLIKVEETGVEQVVQAPFNPIRGFALQLNKNPGRYHCRAHDTISKVTEEILRYKDLQLTPWADDMNIFTDESRVFQCNSTTQKVSMEVTPNVPVERLHESRNSIILRLPPVRGVEKITLSCFTPIAHHDWRITFIEPPTMHFDNNYGSVYCRSNSSDKYIQTLRCQDENRCEFLSHCLVEGEKCNKHKTRLNVFYAKNNGQCKRETNPEIFSCVSMKLNHFNGIVRCGIANVWRTQKFFISLNLNRYFNWKETPKNEMLRMQEVPPIIYTNENETHSFQCEGSYYLFGRNLVFAIRFADGTTKTIPNTLFEDYRNQNPEGKYEYSGSRNINIPLPLNAVGVDCYGYFADSKDFVKVSRNFEMRYERPPYFPKEEYNDKLTFENGTYARILCPAQGEPEPVVSWLYNDKDIGRSGSEYEMSVNSKHHHILEIPRINFNQHGEYKCVASNVLGQVLRKFDVDITMSQTCPPKWS